MRENGVIDLIQNLCDERSWSCYKLAKESGTAYSTLKERVFSLLLRG